MRLDQCCEIVAGATPSTSESEYWGGDICWATPKDLSDLTETYIHDTPRKLTKSGLDSCAATVLPPRSVLFSSRAPIGHVAINTVPMATNQGLKSFVPKDDLVHPEFLFHWLRFNRVYLESLGNGATFKEVSKGVISRVDITLPPLEEQRSIAAILDQAETLRTQRRTALALLDSLTQSLFLDMFGDALANDERTPMGELVSEFRYGTSEKSGNAGFPTLRIPNVASGSLDLSELKTVSVETAEFERLRLLCGDLLFVRTNGNPDYVGRCAVFKPTDVENSGFDSSEFIYASYLIRARLKGSDISPIVLQHYLSEGEGRRALRARCKTSAGQYNINTEGLGAIPIPRFPLPLQQTFATRIAAIEALKATHRRALAALDALFASLQQRAFAGAL